MALRHLAFLVIAVFYRLRMPEFFVDVCHDVPPPRMPVASAPNAHIVSDRAGCKNVRRLIQTECSDAYARYV
jgi:hypothetical protein